MISPKLSKSQRLISERVRALRQARGWTQARLAKELGLSQARLSQIESGAGSFSAEQFLLILKLFNVGLSHFESAKNDPLLVLQNALARLGAAHLHEADNILPSEKLDEIADVVREALASGRPRLITALAPVLVHNAPRLSWASLARKLADSGLTRRVGWLADNVLAAIVLELRAAAEGDRLPRPLENLYRRAAVILTSYLEFAGSERDKRGASDILDETIRSEQSAKEALAASTAISKEWGIITALAPEDFAKALRESRVDV